MTHAGRDRVAFFWEDVISLMRKPSECSTATTTAQGGVGDASSLDGAFLESRSVSAGGWTRKP